MALDGVGVGIYSSLLVKQAESFCGTLKRSRSVGAVQSLCLLELCGLFVYGVVLSVLVDRIVSTVNRY